jgi:hypothetical protein
VITGQEVAVPENVTARGDLAAAAPPAPRAGQVAAPGSFPWPEPWRHSRGARPRSEYWDVATASWHSRGVVPGPREGE